MYGLNQSRTAEKLYPLEKSIVKIPVNLYFFSFQVVS